MSVELRELSTKLQLVNEETVKMSRNVDKIQKSQNYLATSVDSILKKLEPLSERITHLGEKVSASIDQTGNETHTRLKDECQSVKNSLIQTMSVQSDKTQESCS